MAVGIGAQHTEIPTLESFEKSFCFFICECSGTTKFTRTEELGAKWELAVSLLKSAKLVICNSVCNCPMVETTTDNTGEIGITTQQGKVLFPGNPGYPFPSITINNNYNPMYKTKRGCQQVCSYEPRYQWINNC